MEVALQVQAGRQSHSSVAALQVQAHILHLSFRNPVERLKLY